ncbi:phage tail sheath family protein [Tenacibaculum sp. M341]|uniref:phage tail sheath family protein n=1 Tax=Tenacibaculum sp. M341 TaxID=2530339 RepID=UPI0010478BF9|nr:phage tail sheath C-terminal domain-containing protein [Tenacibaculum sp. M341]TCI93205.1 phage tail sheath family protein [Tenacibaculum sp. M341]
MNYKTPGAYVEEISKFPPSVAQVETAIPAFIGYTELASQTEPVRITSLLEYEAIFGKANPETTISATITAGNVVVANPTPKKNNMYYALQMFFANGGGPCYVVSAGAYKAPVAAELVAAMGKLEKEDEPTLLVVPEATCLAASEAYGAVYSEALMQAEKLKDRFVIIDTTSADDLRDELPLSSNLKYGAAYYPNLNTILNYQYNDADVAVTVDGVAGTLADLKTSDSGSYNAVAREIASSLRVQLPPSSAVAGAYAKVDSTSGVWKAPANLGLSYVVGPAVKITKDEQDGLNVDTTAGKSINAIRSFTGKGTLIWGARTLDGNSNEWRYVPVRRFFNMVEESVKNATEGFVFESNDANTWVRIKAMIENFLNQQWTAGALAGAKPEDAYYVSVGLNETMTANDILEGRMIIEIGMAAVRPAEFIVLRFSHKLQES